MKSTQLGVTVRDGILYLGGKIADERFRQAAIVATENVQASSWFTIISICLTRRPDFLFAGRRGMGKGRVEGNGGLALL